MLKIRSTSATFLSLCNLEAAPEKAMQLKRLIKSSNESLGLYLFRKLSFGIFRVSESDFEFWFIVLATYLLASSSKQEEVHSVEWGKRRAIRSICPMEHVP